MKHTHKYIRIKLGANKQRVYYKCALDGCVHKVEAPLVIGRFSLCNICGETFTIDKYSGQLAKPRCNKCIKRDAKDDLDKIEQLFSDM